MTVRGWWMGLTLVLAATQVARAQDVAPRTSGDSGQAVSAAPTAPDSATAAAPTTATYAGPIAVRRPTTPVDGPPMLMQQHANLGQAKAMMFVGGAAFLAGALMGGDAGPIFMVGGAVIGLYGLYEYLK